MMIAHPPRSLTLIACLVTALSGGCRPAPVPGPPMMTLAGETMGTTFSVKVAAELDEQAWLDLETHVHQALDAVDRAMSTYRQDSTLMRLNGQAPGVPFAVEAQTFAVLAEALAVAEATDGAFDIAVGPLVNAWGFGPNGVTGAPDDETLAILKERIDARRQLRLDAATQSAARARDDVFIDLSGIAKGHAADRLAAVLEEAGLSSYLVEVGGEMRAGAAKPDGDSWRVGVERPEVLGGRAYRILALEGTAIATSGDYRNYREVGGERVSHLIDPRDGYPIGHRLASTSVLAERCATADAWATALMVLGPEAGIAAADAHGIAALLLVRAEDGRFEELRSAALLARFPEIAEAAP